MTRVRPSWAIRIRLGLGLAALCLAAPTVPPAAAEDGVPMPASPELLAAAVDEVVGAALETVPELPSSGPVAPVPAIISQEPGAPAVSPPDAAAEPEPPPQQAPAPAAAASEGPAPTESAAPEPDPLPVASQVQPVNVNVSIRVDSPGDSGSVAQVNEVEAADVAPAADASAEQYQPAPPQYQPPQADADAPAASPTGTAAEAAEPGWSWTWSCGDSVTQVLSPDAGSEILPMNWSWNWNWNCGEGESSGANNNAQNSGQYHPGVTRYQPVNVNISIRINSPGNDGPVTQTNVTVVVVSPPVPAIAALPVSVPILGPALAPTMGDAPAQTELVSEASVELTMAIGEAEASDWIFRGSAGLHGVEPAGMELAPDAARSPLAPAASSPGGPAGTQVPPEPSALALRAVAVVNAQASVRPDRPVRAGSPRKPSRHSAPPMRAPVLASGFAGATPGGTDGGGWPLLALLLVPFSLALVDSARRTVRVATIPAAAELRTRRDRPG